jgi:hypothetical protein
MSPKKLHKNVPSSSSGQPTDSSSDVGYKKPPRDHQFKPGQSGNPRGRPKGAKSEAGILHALLHRKLNVREGGRTRQITVLEAIMMRFTDDALKGNTKTAAFILNRYAAMQAGDPLPGAELTEDDRAVLEAFARRLEDDIQTRRKV